MSFAEFRRALLRLVSGAVLGGALALPAAAYDFGQFYGQAREWTIDMNMNGGCIASRPGGDPNDILLLHLPPAGSAQIAIVSFSPEGAEIPGEIRVGSYQRRLNWYVSDGMAWETADPELLTQLARASNVMVRIGGEGANMSLSGSTAALLKLKECWVEMGHRNGIAIEQSREYAAVERDFAGVTGGAVMPPAPAPSASTPSAPAPRVPTQAELNCPEPYVVKSPQTSTPERVTFRNTSGAGLEVSWLDFDGIERFMLSLPAYQQADVDSFTGHIFLARDASGYCHGGTLHVSAGGGSFDLQ